MRPLLPRWFTVLMVIILIAAAATVVSQLSLQASLTAAIDEAAYDLNVLQRRLEKQQTEYAQALADLPDILAQTEEIAPAAQAVYTQEQLLRQQRKDLRAENAALAQEIAGLQEQLRQAADDAGLVEALAHLHTALQQLDSAHQLTSPTP